jgi:hypothetical protein
MHTHKHKVEISKHNFCQISENVYDDISSNYIQMITGSLTVKKKYKEEQEE